MSSTEIALCAGWFISLWLLGWAMLPYSRRLFPRLPDEGLAAGRFLFLVLASLLCFWGASLKIVSLQCAPTIFLTLAISAGWGWLKPANRKLFLQNKRNLLISDAVFALSFALFLWIRLKNPNAGDLEKPMDMALIASAMRSHFLPFENPWLSGTPFTNYYYFGPLMGALLSKTLLIAPHYAYNLIQVSFCAFFLSILWSIGAALTKSVKYGLGVALLVGIGGHLEPLRQISETKKLWPLDWWKTSRIIPNTINEYPSFTMGIGDVHGHFFALSFVVLWFCLVFSLFDASLKRRNALLVVCGLVLGAWLMTNTWDAPLFGLFFAVLAWKTRNLTKRPVSVTPEPDHSELLENTSAEIRAVKLERPFDFAAIPFWLGSFVLAIITALPYFLRFKSQVSGVKVDFWYPDLFSFTLLWGAWWIFAALGQAMPRADEAQSKEAIFRRILIAIGLMALVAPFAFYIRGYFGDGDYRHQDTVFKFGLQAWLLIGLGVSSEFFIRYRALPRQIKVYSYPVLATFIAVLMLAPITVFHTRAIGYAAGGFSLNAMKFLPEAEQQAVVWLQNNAPENSVVLQNAIFKDGSPIGDYDAHCGSIATFTGIPTPLGWPQHVWMWGADMGQVNERAATISEIYTRRDWKKAHSIFGATLVFSPDFVATDSTNKQIFQGQDGSKAQIFTTP